jgi:hypothetical protein
MSRENALFSDDPNSCGDFRPMTALTRTLDPEFAAPANPGRLRWLVSAAIGATLLLPVVLPYSRSAGDVLLTVVTLLFLASRWTNRDWSWLRTPWTQLALVLWGWMLLCTLISGTSRLPCNATTGLPVLRREMPCQRLAAASDCHAVRRGKGNGVASPVSVRWLRSY